MSWHISWQSKFCKYLITIQDTFDQHFYSFQWFEHLDRYSFFQTYSLKKSFWKSRPRELRTRHWYVLFATEFLLYLYFLCSVFLVSNFVFVLTKTNLWTHLKLSLLLVRQILNFWMIWQCTIFGMVCFVFCEGTRIRIMVQQCQFWTSACWLALRLMKRIWNW